MRSFFWKIFLVIWLAKLLLIGMGFGLVWLEYQRNVQRIINSERVQGASEYLISEYETRGITKPPPFVRKLRRQFNRDPSLRDAQRRRGPDGKPRLRGPRFYIRDLENNIDLFKQPGKDGAGDYSINFDITSESGRTYRVFISTDGVFETPRPSYLLARILFVMVLSAVTSGILTLLVLRPLKKLQTQVQNLATGDVSEDMENPMLKRKDEFGEFARTLEQMSDRVRQLIDSKQRLLSDVAHELRAPLARLQVAAEILNDRFANNDPKSSSAELFNHLDQDINALDQLINELLLYARDEQSRTPSEDVALNDLMRSILDIHFFQQWQPISTTQPSESNADDSFSRICFIEDTREILLSTKVSLVERAVRNLLENALKYSPKSSQVRLHLSQTSQWAYIDIVDQGPGIPEDQIKQVMEPFKRLEAETVPGFGLGLSLVQRAMSAIGGELTLINRPEGGLTARLTLPLNDMT